MFDDFKRKVSYYCKTIIFLRIIFVCLSRIFHIINPLVIYVTRQHTQFTRNNKKMYKQVTKTFVNLFLRLDLINLIHDHEVIFQRNNKCTCYGFHLNFKKKLSLKFSGVNI